DRVWCPKAAQERFCQRHAGFLMTGGNDSPLAMLDCLKGRGGFAEVVSEDGEAEHNPALFVGLLPFGQTRHGVATMAGMNKNVAFRMPGRILRSADERFEFG